jgi:hypothetical protein
MGDNVIGQSIAHYRITPSSAKAAWEKCIG